MQGAGPGTLLGGRYALRHRLSKGRDLEHWSAHDTTLEREVALTIVGSGHPNRAGVLDAARRAAGVEDARLVRILDAGNQEGNSFIVEEAMSGSEPLATILLQGPLPAEEARRIAGEAARGLETAGQRGLHHLRLTPRCVLVTPDGAIRVSGMAVAAAVDWRPDEQEPDPATASRRDAVCLVAVVYAALTSRWPLEEQVAGVESAPRVVDRVAAPSEIVAGVPIDLDDLCQMTLNEGTGPLTPADFANQIAPWSRERVYRDGAEPTAVLHLPGWGDVEGNVDNVTAGSSGPEQTAAMSTYDATTQTLSTLSTRSDDEARQPDDSEPETGPAVGDRATPGLLGRDEDLAPPLPMLPASTALTPSHSQSKIVVLVVTAFLMLSLFVAQCALRGPGSGTSTPTPTPAAALGGPPATVPASAPPPPGTTAPTTTGPIAILSATGFDPEGDRNEKNDLAARVYDGNIATAWTTEAYNSAQFGGLKKGAGVLLDLGQPQSVRQVTIDLGSGPVDVTAYAATGPSLDGATVIGTASAATGRIQLKAASATPEAQYIIVWFTTLAPDGGKFRASIAEIALS